MLTVDQTTQSYSGRRGCMCGCQGTYNEGTRARKMSMTSLLKNPAVRLQAWKYSDDAGCLFVDTDTRTRVLYLTQEGVDAARAMGVKEVK
jgi:hypothetical protein